MIMTAVLFITHFFKRKNNYTFLFSTAIAEGIKDVFKEMGYRPAGNDSNNLFFQDDQNPTKIRSARNEKDFV